MNGVMGDSGKEAAPKIALRDKIVKKATESFRTYGIKGITMDEIAASLGISKRTLYEVFQDKEALLQECVLKDRKEMDEFLTEVLVHSNNV